MLPLGPREEETPLHPLLPHEMLPHHPRGARADRGNALPCPSEKAKEVVATVFAAPPSRILDPPVLGKEKETKVKETNTIVHESITPNSMLNNDIKPNGKCQFEDL
jgi:hypothetical protein